MHRVMKNHGIATVRSVCLTVNAFLVCAFCGVQFLSISISDSDQLLVRTRFLELSSLSRFELVCNRPWINLDLETETVMVRSLSSLNTACNKAQQNLNAIQVTDQNKMKYVHKTSQLMKCCTGL